MKFEGGPTSGGRQLPFGKSAEDVLDILSIRLSPGEMSDIVADGVIRINQREMPQYVHLLK